MTLAFPITWRRIWRIDGDRITRFVIFIPPKDFKDESISLIKLFFDKWGVQYKISSYSSKECTGMHGAVYNPDIHTSKVYGDEYDGIVLIDGNGVDEYKLFDYRPLLDLMTKMNDRKKYIISVDNASKIPARANIIKDKRIATDDRETTRLITLFHGVASDKPLEIAGNIISIKSSGDIEDSMQAVLEHVGVT